MSLKRDIALAKYRSLADDLDAGIRAAKKDPAYLGCPPDCHDCCHAGSVLPVGVVEVEQMLDELDSLPEEVRSFVVEKAARIVGILESRGLDAATVVTDPMGVAANALAGKPEAHCPMLVGGVCSVYPSRPLICRAWSVPLSTGTAVNCCPKTVLAKPTDPCDAFPYDAYWRKAVVLSESLGQRDKEPMAFLVLKRWVARRSLGPESN